MYANFKLNKLHRSKLEANKGAETQNSAGVPVTLKGNQHRALGSYQSSYWLSKLLLNAIRVCLHSIGSLLRREAGLQPGNNVCHEAAFLDGAGRVSRVCRALGKTKFRRI